MFPPGICNIDLPVPIRQCHFHSSSSLPLELSVPLFRQRTKILQLLIHIIMYLPPFFMCHVTRIHKLFHHIPITIIISVAKPWLQTQIMYTVKLWWVSPKKPIFNTSFIGAISPKILQEINSSRQPMPPYKNLIEKPLVTTIVRDDVVSMVH